MQNATRPERTGEGSYPCIPPPHKTKTTHPKMATTAHEKSTGTTVLFRLKTKAPGRSPLSSRCGSETRPSPTAGLASSLQRLLPPPLRIANEAEKRRTPTWFGTQQTGLLINSRPIIIALTQGDRTGQERTLSQKARRNKLNHDISTIFAPLPACQPSGQKEKSAAVFAAGFSTHRPPGISSTRPHKLKRQQ